MEDVRFEVWPNDRHNFFDRREVSFRDAHGIFEIRSLRGGEYKVDLLTAEGQVAPTQRISVLAGESKGGLAFVVVAGATLRGRVVDPKGAPLSAASISCGQAHAQSDADGAFQITGIPVGRQRVMMMSGESEEDWDVDVPEGAETLDLHTTRLFPIAFPEASSGVCAERVGDKLTIRSLSAKAKAAGLAQGQTIQSVGDIPGSEIGRSGARGLLGGRPGEHVTLTLADPPRTLTLAITTDNECD